ncbi:MAG: putative toxin-antitoxin system toxin component, PIN family [candidate division NC10 bacterium]|nr:putative toxin-antitoxin system toxin component, PIN family [candidate division NC10 bacterium]
MLKAVLDTNVIVSGIISKGGIPFQLLEAWRDREWDLLISPRILQEIQRVLGFPKIARVYALTRQDITGLIWLFSHRATLVPEHLTIPRTARDPEDDHLLACAKEGKADYIVSGDQDLLTLTSYEGTPIVTPAAFAAILKAAR